jgi:hypothetical protein
MAIEGVRQRHRLPTTVIIVRLGSVFEVTDFQTPSSIKIQLYSLRRNQVSAQQPDEDCQEKNSFHNKGFT